MALFLVPGLAAAGPMLLGSFRAEPYGQFELRTEGERLFGSLVDGGACRLSETEPALEGEFQGSVLIGRLRVCQTGNGCEPEKAYPILAFYNEQDHSLVAHVRLRSGCQSPALKQGRFVLQPVRKLDPPEPAPAVATTTSTASDLASKRASGKIEAAREANELGFRLYQQHDYKGAASSFRASLGHDKGSSNLAAYLGLGSSLLKLNNQEKEAIFHLERARSFQPKNSRVLYMLGCAHGQRGNKKQSLGFLRQAVEEGFELHEAIKGDPELERFLGGEKEFQELLKLSREKKQQAQSRGTSGPGSPSP